MEYDRDIVQMYATDAGKLWVLTSRGALPEAEDSLGVFDVFDREGYFERQIDLKGDGDFKHDRYYLAGDRLYVLKRYADAWRSWSARFAPQDTETEEEPEQMAVICYRVPEEAIR